MEKIEPIKLNESFTDEDYFIALPLKQFNRDLKQSKLGQSLFNEKEQIAIKAIQNEYNLRGYPNLLSNLDL